MKIIFILLLICNNIFAAEKSFAPDYFQTQVMGYQGSFSFGTGWEMSDYFDLTPSLGLSYQEDSNDFLFQGNLQSKFYPLSTTNRIEVIKPFIGLTMLYGFDRDLFLVLPKQYPDNYYSPTALRGTVDFGIKIRWSDQIEANLQYSILDSEIAPLYGSSEQINNGYKFGSGLLGLRYRI